MLLEAIKLNEVKYARGRTVYFVSAVDPLDGDMEIYAGPFQDEQHAEKFKKDATAIIEKIVQASEEPERNRNDMPVFITRKIVGPQAFLEEITQHIESFLV